MASHQTSLCFSATTRSHGARHGGSMLAYLKQHVGDLVTDTSEKASYHFSLRTVSQGIELKEMELLHLGVYEELINQRKRSSIPLYACVDGQTIKYSKYSVSDFTTGLRTSAITSRTVQVSSNGLSLRCIVLPEQVAKESARKPTMRFSFWSSLAPLLTKIMSRPRAMTATPCSVNLVLSST